ncbi:hypothetical protein Nepgr_017261 [Nepenthes gracilis]|uniref:Uncharacterized protein n=1 Tax=Nepenthes gracilis TaxID=150966 RepID=A0AAD3XT81_NEPGR|nr:hypothetical protein Nepgr_017261 [Nepenthes gracilis]
MEVAFIRPSSLGQPATSSRLVSPDQSAHLTGRCHLIGRPHLAGCPWLTVRPAPSVGWSFDLIIPVSITLLAASHVISIALYSALADNLETIFGFFDFHETRDSLTNTQKSVVAGYWPSLKLRILSANRKPTDSDTAESSKVVYAV